MRNLAGAKMVDGKIVYETFPKVFKHIVRNETDRCIIEKAFIVVIYKDHSETFVLSSVYRGEKDVPYDPDAEIRMCRDNGGKEIHANEIRE